MWLPSQEGATALGNGDGRRFHFPHVRPHHQDLPDAPRPRAEGMRDRGVQWSDWPCWPEPRPKAHRPPTRVAREVRSLGKQSSDSQGQYGPGVSAPWRRSPRGGIGAYLPPLRPVRFAFWGLAEPDRLEAAPANDG